MTLRVLGIGDVGNQTLVLSKFLKKSKIHLIAFPREGNAIKTYADDMEFFSSYKVTENLKKINEIKDDFDICLTTFAGARLAYLADLNYIMYFVGDDIRTPPFIKNPKDPFLNQPLPSLNFLERRFYKKVLENASVCIAFDEELYSYLKKYRKDAISLNGMIPVDTTIFNDAVRPIEREKTKFTFLSAQRIGPSKGIDIIWEALRLCKTDFEVLQVEWFEERNEEERKINKHFLETKPPQVKLIPLIKREELPRYYVFADAIIGQIGLGTQANVEREAVFCKKPVIHYPDPKIKYIINGKEVTAPFLPKTKDPKDLANIIDMVVESKEFREKLAEEEYNFIKKLCDPDSCAKLWDEIFEMVCQKQKTISKNSSYIIKKIRIFFFLVANRFYFSKFKKIASKVIR